MQRVAPYQAGNPGRANNIVAGKFGNNGHQAAQQVSTMPSTKSDNATMDLPQMMEMAMRNVKVTPTKGKLHVTGISLYSSLSCISFFLRRLLVSTHDKARRVGFSFVLETGKQFLEGVHRSWRQKLLVM